MHLLRAPELVPHEATGEVTSSPLERTRTGHLVLDPFLEPTNLMSLKKQAEERYGVTLPNEAARLFELFSSPGAIQALGKDGSASYEQVTDPSPGKEAGPCGELCAVGHVSAEHVGHAEGVREPGSSVFMFSCLSEASECCCAEPEHPPDHARPPLEQHQACPRPSQEIYVTGARDHVIPSLPHRIKALQLRLAAFQLRLSPASHGEGPCASGRPSSERMALPRQALGWQGEGQPVCSVGRLPEVRSEDILCGDQGPRREAHSWANDRGDPGGHEGAGDDVRPRRDPDGQRDGGPWQDHGGAEPVAAGRRTDPPEEDDGPGPAGGPTDVQEPPSYDFEGGTLDEARTIDGGTINNSSVQAGSSRHKAPDGQ